MGIRKINNIIDLIQIKNFLNLPVSYRKIIKKNLPWKSNQDKRIAANFAFEYSADTFYALFFAGIASHLRGEYCGHVKLIDSCSINGAIGDNFNAKLRRSWCASRIRANKWMGIYYVFCDGIGFRSSNIFLALQKYSKHNIAQEVWNNLKKQKNNYSLIVNGIEIADLIIDTYLRYKPSPKFDVEDDFVFSILLQALVDLEKAELFFLKSRISAYFTTYTTYVEHGIPVRVALKYGVRVISFGNMIEFGKVLNKTDPYHQPNGKKYKDDFDKLQNSAILLDKAESQLKKRISGVIDTSIGYMINSPYAKRDLSDRLDLKGAVIIFLHDFYDSPHVFPNMVFTDFYEWFVFTVEQLTSLSINICIKPHPNQSDINTETISDLKKKYSNLTWLESEINNADLVRFGILAGISVYGSICHELAYLGINTYTCADNPHASFQFCNVSKSKLEYRDKLSGILKLKNDSNKTRDEALKFFYMHNLHKCKEDAWLLNNYVMFWRKFHQYDVFDREKDVKLFMEFLKSDIFLKKIDHFVK
jgi:hypothetical protein